MKKSEIKMLDNNLCKDSDLIDTLFSIVVSSFYFDNIEEFRKYLIKYHDLLVDVYNKGADTFNRAIRGRKCQNRN